MVGQYLTLALSYHPLLPTSYGATYLIHHSYLMVWNGVWFLGVALSRIFNLRSKFSSLFWSLFSFHGFLSAGHPLKWKKKSSREYVNAKYKENKQIRGASRPHLEAPIPDTQAPHQSGFRLSFFLPTNWHLTMHFFTIKENKPLFTGTALTWTP